MDAGQGDENEVRESVRVAQDDLENLNGVHVWASRVVNGGAGRGKRRAGG